MVTSITSFAKDISKSALQWSRHQFGVRILFLATSKAAPWEEVCAVYDQGWSW